MLKNVQLVHKLPLILISFALMAAIATGAIAYLQSTRALYDQTEATLFALLESRETTLRQYLGTVEKDMVARIGGDEFLFIVSHDHSENEREYIAEKILSNIEKPFNIANSPVHIGVSIGIATYPTHATNIRDLLRLADEAMYRAKARGKNRFAYCDDLIVSQQTDIS
ncbi:Cyclic di-GMP phosphodiesterase Gmr [Roseibium album]|nr:Cyclic di-GMP phosphodiesterase Gmr [Roseibium album]